jgi:hypothetical protein
MDGEIIFSAIILSSSDPPWKEMEKRPNAAYTDGTLGNIWISL